MAHKNEVKGSHKANGRSRQKHKNPPTEQELTKERRRERPEGLTGIMARYNQSKDPRYLAKGQKLYLSIYLHQGLSVGGYAMNLDQVSRFLRIEKMELVERLTGNVIEVMGSTGGKEGIENLSRVIISSLFGALFADRALITDQVQNLKAAQGIGYVPFLSGEYNKSLKLLLESHKPFLELLKSLQPQGPTTAIQINNNPSKNSVPNGQAISTHEALKIIDDSRNGTTLLEDERAKDLLQQTYMIGPHIPEIIATKQMGETADGRPSKVRKVTHEDRSEAQGPIVLPA